MDYKKLNNGIGRMMYSLREDKDFNALKVIIDATRGHLVMDDINEGFGVAAADDNLSKTLVTKQKLSKLERLELMYLKKSDCPNLDEEIYELIGKKVRFEFDFLHLYTSESSVKGIVTQIWYDETKQDLLINLQLRQRRMNNKLITITRGEVKNYEIEIE